MLFDLKTSETIKSTFINVCISISCTIELHYQTKFQLMDQQKNENAYVQSLKNLLTQILHKNTAYDCMPINSSINSIDKSVSLYEAINILISKDLQELLIWDEEQSKWVWMLTLVDCIRLITHAFKSLLRRNYIDFTDFQKQIQEKEGQMISTLSQFNKEQLCQLIKKLNQKSISDIIKQITELSPVKTYVRLKTIEKDSKLEMAVLIMQLQKIHRIIIEDPECQMFISVLNFKDIFLFIMRIANQSPATYQYGAIGIHSILQAGQYKNIQIEQSKPLWQAFQIMTDRNKSLWINVVDKQRRFQGMLFREDFRQIFQGWHIDCMWVSVGDFIRSKNNRKDNRVPQFRYFQPTQSTKDILWKMIMSRRNAIVWIDKDQRIKATIGLMQIFKLYIT